MHLQENSVGVSAQVQGHRKSGSVRLGAGGKTGEAWRGGPGVGGHGGVLGRHCRGLWINAGCQGAWRVGVWVLPLG